MLIKVTWNARVKRDKKEKGKKKKKTWCDDDANGSVIEFHIGILSLRRRGIWREKRDIKGKFDVPHFPNPWQKQNPLLSLRDSSRVVSSLSSLAPIPSANVFFFFCSFSILICFLSYSILTPSFFHSISASGGAPHCTYCLFAKGQPRILGQINYLQNGKRAATMSLTMKMLRQLSYGYVRAIICLFEWL